MTKLVTVGVYIALSDMETRRRFLSRPFYDEETKAKYDRLSDMAAKQSMSIVMLLEGSYQAGQTFSPYWKKVGSVWQEFLTPLTVDLVFVKSVHLVDSLEENTPVAAHRELEKLNDDKLYMYSFFKEYMALSLSISAENWQEVLGQIPTEQVALKPIDGSCGDGIVIGHKDTVRPEDLNPEYAYLAQEFVDNSAGIPGLAEGNHDLRIIVYNGKARLANVRLAPQGSLLANVALGASLKAVDVAEIPAAALELAAQVDNRLKNFSPRLYTVDIMYGPSEKPYLVEINTAPGLPNPAIHGQKYTDSFNQFLIDDFFEAIELQKAS